MSRPPCFGAQFPRCATSDQFIAWVAAGRTCAKEPVFDFCSDCSPEYQRASMAGGTCDRPYIKFFRSRDGDLYGALEPRQPNMNVEVRSSDEAWIPLMVSDDIARELGMH